MGTDILGVRTRGLFAQNDRVKLWFEAPVGRFSNSLSRIALMTLADAESFALPDRRESLRFFHPASVAGAIRREFPWRRRALGMAEANRTRAGGASVQS